MDKEAENHETAREPSVEEMRADLERAGYLDLIPQIMKNHPGVTEAEAITDLHSFY